jgi:NADH:ubiquinone oxidoreductase subunit F (NADH-binding)
VNATEGEPASGKDRVLLHYAPHLVLDGAVATADAIGAKSILVAITRPEVEAPLRAAISQRPDARRFDVRLLPDRFVTGEARALINGLNGQAAVPPGRRVLPTESGVNGRPTLLSNAETFAHVGLIARHGAGWFTGIGTPDEPGTVLLSVGGAVGQPGVIEVPTGTTLGEVAAQVRANTGASAPQAVIIGGYHGGWLPYDASIRLDRKDLARRGASLGAGVLIFVGSDTCPSLELARVTRWLAAQSAKQCGPCVFGLPALANDVAELVQGRHSTGLRRHLENLPGRGACAHPDGSVRFVQSGLGLIAADVAKHQKHAHCGRPDRGYLPTPGTV